MLAAGLLAKKAVEKGLKVKPYVKTSLAPGSRVVTDYLEKSGLSKPLDRLGFTPWATAALPASATAAPCPTPWPRPLLNPNLVAAAVLSGNRNFEGRINPLVKANYLASPPLVVAYALAGTIDIDLSSRTAGQAATASPFFSKIFGPPNPKSTRWRPTQSLPKCSASNTPTSSMPTKHGTPCPWLKANCSPGTKKALTSKSRRFWPN